MTALLLAAALLAGSWQPAPAATHSRPLYLVLIVMDGFRPDYETLAPMHHLHALMAQGMTYDDAWVGQMESETPTGHATIGTGIYPARHGVVGFGWKDPATGAFVYTPTDVAQIRAGALRRQIEQGGVPTISDLIHLHNPHDRVASISGEKYYASSTMGAGADYILYGKEERGAFRPVSIGPNVPPPSTHYQSITGDFAIELQDRFASSLAVQMVRTLRPRALLLNLPGTDIGGHYYGSMRDPRDMARVIRATDWAIGRVVGAYRALGLLGRTLFVVTADHGMASNRHIVHIHAMYDALRTAGEPTVDQEYRITAGSIWLKDPSQAESVAALMASRRFQGVEGALYRLPSRTAFAAEPGTAKRLPPALLRAYLDLADTEAGPTGPDVLLPYGEDTTGLTVAHRKLWGSHGGFSWGVQHIPLILAGPGVRHGVSAFPAKLVDVAPTIERLLGFPVPANVDGVVLADTLNHSSAPERAAQAAVRVGRLQDVNALRAHSLAQAHN